MDLVYSEFIGLSWLMIIELNLIQIARLPMLLVVKN
jgi:hypothetical protein